MKPYSHKTSCPNRRTKKKNNLTNNASSGKGHGMRAWAENILLWKTQTKE